MINLLNVECRADGNCFGTERLPTGSGRTHSFHRSMITQYNVETWSPKTAWRPQNTTTSMSTIASNTVIRSIPTLQAGVGSLALPTIDIGQHFASRQEEINQKMTTARDLVNADTARIFTESLQAQQRLQEQALVNLNTNNNAPVSAGGIPQWAYYAAGAVVLLLALFFLMKK